ARFSKTEGQRFDSCRGYYLQGAANDRRSPPANAGGLSFLAKRQPVDHHPVGTTPENSAVVGSNWSTPVPPSTTLARPLNTARLFGSPPAAPCFTPRSSLSSPVPARILAVPMNVTGFEAPSFWATEMVSLPDPRSAVNVFANVEPASIDQTSFPPYASSEPG